LISNGLLNAATVELGCPPRSLSLVSITPVDLIVFVFFLYSVIAHEVAHGWVALKCGDPTAKFAGRLTANPIPHIDPVWSIIVPLLCFLSPGHFFFGMAKPVPVRESNLRQWPRDAILVSIAGVTANLLIAIACAAVFRLLGLLNPNVFDTYSGRVLIETALTNIFLMLFNLVPIPPLDGSRVFIHLLPADLRPGYRQLERFGFIIIIVLFQIPVFSDALNSAALRITALLLVR
jgi:Zn-dependent protease